MEKAWSVDLVDFDQIERGFHLGCDRHLSREDEDEWQGRNQIAFASKADFAPRVGGGYRIRSADGFRRRGPDDCAGRDARDAGDGRDARDAAASGAALRSPREAAHPTYRSRGNPGGGARSGAAATIGRRTLQQTHRGVGRATRGPKVELRVAGAARRTACRSVRLAHITAEARECRPHLRRTATADVLRRRRVRLGNPSAETPHRRGSPHEKPPAARLDGRPAPWRSDLVRHDH